VCVVLGLKPGPLEARQELYHLKQTCPLSFSLAFFFFFFFWDRISLSLLRLASKLLSSAFTSLIAGVMDVHHCVWPSIFIIVFFWLIWLSWAIMFLLEKTPSVRGSQASCPGSDHPTGWQAQNVGAEDVSFVGEVWGEAKKLYERSLGIKDPVLQTILWIFKFYVFKMIINDNSTRNGIRISVC
jgi:hypothetical protein